MRTYALDMDGTPKLAFRAKDDACAENWPKRGVGRWCVRDYQGVLTVRPATIPEQAEWRAQSIAMEELSDDGRELKLGSYGSGPDYYVVVLDPDDGRLQDIAKISGRVTTRRKAGH